MTGAAAGRRHSPVTNAISFTDPSSALLFRCCPLCNLTKAHYPERFGGVLASHYYVRKGRNLQRTDDASIKPGCKPALVRLICASSCSVTHRPDASPDLITTSLLPKTLNCITLVRPKLEYPFLCNPTTGTENRANESPYLQLCLLIFANFTVAISVVVGSHQLANSPPPRAPQKAFAIPLSFLPSIHIPEQRASFPSCNWQHCC